MGRFFLLVRLLIPELYLPLMLFFGPSLSSLSKPQSWHPGKIAGPYPPLSFEVKLLPHCSLAVFVVQASVVKLCLPEVIAI